VFVVCSQAKLQKIVQPVHLRCSIGDAALGPLSLRKPRQVRGFSRSRVTSSACLSDRRPR
jgi:hypothetical protein